MTSSASRAAFDRLAEPIRRWIERQGWSDLSEIQTKAVEPIVGGDRDVLLTAATAGGKTEAAFFPILSHLAERRRSAAPAGVEVLYISPLKALINDQHRRLEELAELIDVPVHPWHGDIAASRKKRAWRDRAGVLLITPESIEGMLCTRGDRVRELLGDLRYVVIDELHAFPGGPRGAQLSSLLHRIDLVGRRRVPRIGLSATLGKVDLAAEFLRPGRAERVTVVEAGSTQADRQTRLVGFTRTVDGGGVADVADRMWRTLRGETNLVFANARGKVETYADRLRHESEQRRLPNEFFAHHGSLSKAEREDIEAQLKSDRPATAVCTSTLEMGIDIGRVKQVVQVDCPPSVAALRQRWGRSGRRPGDPSVLRTYIVVDALEPTTSPQDALRWELFQTVAMLELIRVHDWCEEAEHGGLHLSTLVQQILSLTAQHGGVTAAQAESVLCVDGPFRVDHDTFAQLVEAMTVDELLTTSSDDLLFPGRRGERAVEHFSFYAAFASPDVVRVVNQGQEIGSISAVPPLFPGKTLVLAGRRWRVLVVDQDRKTVEVAPDATGKPPSFGGAGAARIHDEVRAMMEQLYLGTVVPPYLDDEAKRLLDEGRAMFAQLGLHRTDLVPRGNETVLFPWRGDRVLDTVMVALRHYSGVQADRDGPALVVEAPAEVVARALTALASADPPAALDLAATVAQKVEEKWDDVLSPALLDQAYAARALNVDGAWAWLRQRAERSYPAPTSAASVPTLVPPPDEPVGASIALATTPFAVVDVETTGLAASRGHRVVEIAIASCRPDGSVEDFWHTLLDPGVDLGPSHVHGLVAEDVVGAPTFAAVVGDIAARLDGRVVVAHNAPFDLSFLHLEFARAGHVAPPWPTLCTMKLLDRTVLPGRTLGDACVARGISLENAHSAREDALAAAALLASVLAELKAASFEELGVSAVRLPVPWTSPPPSGLSSPRSTSAMREATDLPTWMSAGETAYADAVAGALRDGEITSTEVDVLVGVAREWSVPGDRIADIHDRVLGGGESTPDRQRLASVERTAQPASAP